MLGLHVAWYFQTHIQPMPLKHCQSLSSVETRRQSPLSTHVQFSIKATNEGTVDFEPIGSVLTLQDKFTHILCLLIMVLSAST